MKLENERSYVIDQMKKLDPAQVKAYAAQVKASGDYRNFETRIANDILAACIPVPTRCNWYEKYNCNDTHITTLARACVKEIFGTL